MSNLRGEIFYSCASLGYNFGTKSVFRLHIIILPYSICAKLCGVEQNKVYLSSKYWVLFEPQTPYGLPLKRLKTWLDVDLPKNLHKIHQNTFKAYQITFPPSFGNVSHLWMRSYSADFGFCRSVIKWIATFVLSSNFLAFWRVLQTFWLLAPKAQKLGLRTLRRARSEAYPAQTCPNSLIALKKQLSCRLTSLAQVYVQSLSMLSSLFRPELGLSEHSSHGEGGGVDADVWGWCGQLLENIGHHRHRRPLPQKAEAARHDRFLPPSTLCTLTTLATISAQDLDCICLNCKGYLSKMWLRFLPYICILPGWLLCILSTVAKSVCGPADQAQTYFVKMQKATNFSFTYNKLMVVFVQQLNNVSFAQNTIGFSTFAKMGWDQQTRPRHIL